MTPLSRPGNPTFASRTSNTLRATPPSLWDSGLSRSTRSSCKWRIPGERAAPESLRGKLHARSVNCPCFYRNGHCSGCCRRQLHHRIRREKIVLLAIPNCPLLRLPAHGTFSSPFCARSRFANHEAALSLPPCRAPAVPASPTSVVSPLTRSGIIPHSLWDLYRPHSRR